MKYLIWSIQHNAWWRPNSRGYTTKRADAGRYTLEEAQEICISANLYELTKPCEAIVPEVFA